MRQLEQCQLALAELDQRSRDIFRKVVEGYLEAGEPMEAARKAVLADPRVASRARTMQGFDGNIGKYVSLAYLEAEKEAF